MPNEWQGRFVGVVPPSAFSDQGYPKHLLLMFDALALDLSRGGGSGFGRVLPDHIKADMAWLTDEGLLSTLGGLAAGRGGGLRRLSVSSGGLLPAGLERRVTSAIQTSVLGHAGIDLRRTAADLRHLGIDAVAIPPVPLIDLDGPATRDVVLRVTLSEFPIPSDTTPWEAIKEFRQDPNARAQWFRLKNWVNEIARAGRSSNEVADQLRALSSDYAQSLRLVKMQTQASAIEVFLTTTAAVAENVIKLNWEAATKAAFSITKHTTQLLAAEKDMKGREVAYVVTAKSRFGS